MRLEELKEKLYKKRFQPQDRQISPSQYEAGKSLPAEEETKKWEEMPYQKGLAPEKKKFLFKIGLIAAISAAVALSLFFYINSARSFSKKDVKLKIFGPAEAVSGEEIEFNVESINNSKMALEDAGLVFQCPQYNEKTESISFIKEQSLGRIETGETKNNKFKCGIIGEEQETKIVQVRLAYKPKNLNSRFENPAESSITVNSLPLSIEIESPPQVLSGARMDFSVAYKNTGKNSFSNLRIKLNYPSDFAFSSSDPPAAEFSDTWDKHELKIGEQGEIKISGILKGSENETKRFEVVWGVMENSNFIKYGSKKSTIRISSSPLILSQTVNKSPNYIANPGDFMDYEISYKNNTDIGLKELVLKAKLEGKMYDFTTLKADKANFDEANRVLTWSAASNPDFLVLEPAKEGKINFSVRLKDRFPIESAYDKNFSVKVSLDLETPTVPFGFAEGKLSTSSQIETKINTRLIINAKGYYYDSTSGIANQGPIPPKVGETTSYTIHWELVNLSNDAKNVQLKATLPQGVDWADRFSVSNNEQGFSYNSRTKQIVWDIGDLSATVGVALPVYRAVFQISITPSTNQAGSFIDLIGETMVVGADEFTGVSLTGTDSAISTTLPDDPAIGSQGGRVVN